MAALTLADGTSVMGETIFESRFKQVGELVRMGADISVEGVNAIVRGVNHLHGAVVQATDLRGGAALAIAALAAEGESRIREIGHIDRGYESVETALASLGANIWRE